MIKNALKTFFKNLIYLFVPMGIIYLFFILIVFGAVSSVVSAAGGSLNAFFTLVSDTVSGSEAVVQDYFNYAFGLIDWNGNFFDILQEVISTDWLYRTVIGFLDTLGYSVSGFEGRASVIVEELVSSLTLTVSVAIAALALSIFLANLVTRTVIRRKNARRNLKKKIVALIVQSTLVVAILGVGAYLFALWRFSVIFTVIVYVPLTSFTSLLCSWFIHGKGNVKLRNAVNFRSTCAYLASSVIIIGICVCALALIELITNALLMILIAVPLVVYAANIIDVNADSYVLNIAAQSPESRLLESPEKQ